MAPVKLTFSQVGDRKKFGSPTGPLEVTAGTAAGPDPVKLFIQGANTLCASGSLPTGVALWAAVKVEGVSPKRFADAFQGDTNMSINVPARGGAQYNAPKPLVLEGISVGGPAALAFKKGSVGFAVVGPASGEEVVRLVAGALPEVLVGAVQTKVTINATNPVVPDVKMQTSNATCVTFTEKP